MSKKDKVSLDWYKGIPDADSAVWSSCDEYVGFFVESEAMDTLIV